MTVIIGIDPHKASHTATAICPGLAEAATIRVRATRSTPQELLSWAARWPERRWAIEGARGLGQLLAQRLVAAGEHVVDVPATLSARVRTLDTGHGRKTDHIDARAVAIVATQRPDLPRVGADDHRRVLRLLADRRDELTKQRRRTLNRLHRHLRDLIPGGAPVHLSANTAAGLLAKIRPHDSVEAERKQMARDLLADLRRLDKATAENRRRCAAAVAASGTTLTQLAGISDVLAAKILGHIGDISRFPSADHLASYAGTTLTAAGRCFWATRTVAVKYRYSLAVDTTERTAVATALNQCPANVDATVPARANVTTAPTTQTPSPTTATSDCHPAYDPCLPNLPGDALNCGDLTAAQKPVRIRQIGVDPYRLDLDRNGSGCTS